MKPTFFYLKTKFLNGFQTLYLRNQSLLDQFRDVKKKEKERREKKKKENRIEIDRTACQ